MEQMTCLLRLLRGHGGGIPCASGLVHPDQTVAQAQQTLIDVVNGHWGDRHRDRGQGRPGLVWRLKVRSRTAIVAVRIAYYRRRLIGKVEGVEIVGVRLLVVGGRISLLIIVVRLIVRLRIPIGILGVIGDLAAIISVAIAYILGRRQSTAVVAVAVAYNLWRRRHLTAMVAV